MNKQQLAAKIWKTANNMRSKIEANEYKDYILGFIFYKFLSDKLEQLVTFLGGSYSYAGEYPGWEYKKTSKLRDIYVETFKDVTGKQLKIEAIHAGLECGIIAEKINDLDIIAIGPDMHDIHTTEERLNISSTKRVFDVVVEVLKKFCEMTR